MTKRKPKEEHKPTGRPTRYKKEFDDLAFKFALLGGIDKKIAEFFDVQETTLNNWKAKYPSFLESLNRGKHIANAEVAHSLYQRAIGYSTTETKIATFMGAITDKQDVTKNYPPDVAAGCFFLKNRTGGKYQQTGAWADKQEVEHSGDIGVTFNLDFG